MSIITLAGGAMTMTSREIAELTGKEHRHVLRDIEVLRSQLGSLFVGSVQSWTHPQNGQTYPEFLLDKDTTLCLVSGYDAVVRMKIIKRWQELESQNAIAIPKTMAQALRLAADQAEQIEAQQAQIEAAKPAVEFVGKYVQATGLKGFREVCKLLKANESRFRAFLMAEQIMYRLGGVLTAYQNHIDAGRFDVRTGVSDTEHAFTTTKFTAKGIDWIAGRWAQWCLHNEQAA